MEKNIKPKDIVLFSGDFFTVEWIDDSGVSDLIGLKSKDGEIKVTNFSEKIILKIKSDNN
jgi:hypothetical protein